MTAPAKPAPALSPELLDGIVARAARPDFPAFERQLRSSGYCARPVRLRGTIETCDHDGTTASGQPKTSPTACCARRAGTAARPYARDARSATAKTPTT
jgi:hypothetical protein